MKRHRPASFILKQSSVPHFNCVQNLFLTCSCSISHHFHHHLHHLLHLNHHLHHHYLSHKPVVRPNRKIISIPTTNSLTSRLFRQVLYAQTSDPFPESAEHPPAENQDDSLHPINDHHVNKKDENARDASDDLEDISDFEDVNDVDELNDVDVVDDLDNFNVNGGAKGTNRNDVNGNNLANIKFRTNYISQLGLQGKSEEALKVFRAFPDNDSTVYIAMMQVYARKGLWQFALKLLQEMKNKGMINISYHAYAMCMTACVKSMDGDLGAAAFSHSSKRNSRLSSKAWKSANVACDMVLRIFDQVKNDRLSPGKKIYTIALMACQRVGRFKKALQILYEMKGAQMDLDHITYNIVLSACDKGSQSNLVVAVFDEMVKLGIKPTVGSYTILLKGLLGMNDFNQAQKLFEDVVGSRQDCDLIFYNTFISALAQRGQFSKTLTILDDLRSRDDLQPDVVTYGACMHACEKAGKSDLCFSLYQESQRNGIQPNVYLFATLIKACSGTGDWRRAVRYFEEMEQMNIKPNVVIYNAMVHIFGRSGNPKRALQILYIMEKRGVMPNLITYNSAIKACVQSRKVHTAIVLFEEMLEYNINPDVYTFTSLIHMHISVNNIEAAVDTLIDMCDKYNIIPDRIIYCTFINGTDRCLWYENTTRTLNCLKAKPSQTSTWLQEKVIATYELLVNNKRSKKSQS